MADAQNHRLKHTHTANSQTYTFVIMFLSRLTKVSTLVVCNTHLKPNSIYQTKKSGKTESWNIWAASHFFFVNIVEPPFQVEVILYGPLCC